MSTAETIRKHVLRVRRGEPFTNTRLLKLGSRASVDKTLCRLVDEGVIQCDQRHSGRPDSGGI
ncbi:MAG TPA: hypothetical protein ENI62_05465 [Gammaproteobacteria bacterium]|nr:hypothetical protein [Gammaproteobacteria bacterium]